MILDEIVTYTRERVKKEKAEKPGDYFYDEAIKLGEQEEKLSYPFEEALKRKGINFICEVKKASPSKGLIAKGFDYVKIAKDYEIAGAACISVLTEPRFFQGKDQYLKEIHHSVGIPVLRKDFIVDEYQIYQAKVLGASCVLLICSVLTMQQLVDYLHLCEKLHLSALVEAHDEEEVRKALACGAKILGVNNRNLKDFTVNLQTSIQLRKLVPNDVLFVAESGIKTPEDILQLEKANVNGVLIGETMMKSTNKSERMQFLKSLLSVEACG